MVQFASYLRRVLCKTRFIFPRINGPSLFNPLKHALFFNRQGLPFLPVGFFFVINSTFNLGPGVIACTTGVFQASEGKREASEELRPPSRVSGAPRPRGACLCPL